MSEKPDKKEQGLKPCPFCGGNSIDITTSGVNPRSWLIGCEDCLCRLTSNDESRELGIELWNTRINDQLKKELKEMKNRNLGLIEDTIRGSKREEKLERMVEQLQAELDKYNWIAVDDKLPPKNIPIWLYNSEFNYTHKASLLYPETYLNNNPHETHWMPLPDPPQTEIDITMYGKEYPDSHLACPGCGIDAGHDRETPPNPYYCDKCSKKLEEEENE